MYWEYKSYNLVPVFFHAPNFLNGKTTFLWESFEGVNVILISSPLQMLHICYNYSLQRRLRSVSLCTRLSYWPCNLDLYLHLRHSDLSFYAPLTSLAGAPVQGAHCRGWRIGNSGRSRSSRDDAVEILSGCAAPWVSMQENETHRFSNGIILKNILNILYYRGARQKWSPVSMLPLPS